MITTERISNWLKEPHHLQEIAPRVSLQLANQYPYFAPAHYIKFIALKQESAILHDLQHSFPVNRVLLALLLEQAQQTGEELYPVSRPPGQEGDNEKIPENEEPEETIIIPLSANDYFLQQGIKVSEDLPEADKDGADDDREEKALMVVMSFAEWLNFIHSKSKKDREEEEDQRALKTMWQKQKLAAAIEEGSEEIPEQVFEMAVNSISRPNELISESLADIYVKQGKKEKAIEMYKKLSLLNPEKNTYFAAKIENIQKEL